jgi:hypothetical protein
MTLYLDDTPLADDAGLDPRCVADLLQRDANPSDVIDQAIIVPLPDDDRDVDTYLFEAPVTSSSRPNRMPRLGRATTNRCPHVTRAVSNATSCPSWDAWS